MSRGLHSGGGRGGEGGRGPLMEETAVLGVKFRGGRLMAWERGGGELTVPGVHSIGGRRWVRAGAGRADGVGRAVKERELVVPGVHSRGGRGRRRVGGMWSSELLWVQVENLHLFNT